MVGKTGVKRKKKRKVGFHTAPKERKEDEGDDSEEEPSKGKGPAHFTRSQVRNRTESDRPEPDKKVSPPEPDAAAAEEEGIDCSGQTGGGLSMDSTAPQVSRGAETSKAPHITSRTQVSRNRVKDAPWLNREGTIMLSDYRPSRTVADTNLALPVRGNGNNGGYMEGDTSLMSENVREKTLDENVDMEGGDGIVRQAIIPNCLSNPSNPQTVENRPTINLNLAPGDPPPEPDAAHPVRSLAGTSGGGARIYGPNTRGPLPPPQSRKSVVGTRLLLQDPQELDLQTDQLLTGPEPGGERGPLYDPGTADQDGEVIRPPIVRRLDESYIRNAGLGLADESLLAGHLVNHQGAFGQLVQNMNDVAKFQSEDLDIQMVIKWIQTGEIDKDFQFNSRDLIEYKRNFQYLALHQFPHTDQLILTRNKYSFDGEISEKWVCPLKLRKALITQAHLTLAHLGSHKVVAHLTRFTWWPSLYTSVRTQLQTCHGCIFKAKRDPTKQLQGCHTTRYKYHPAHTVHLDFAGPLARTAAPYNYQYLLSMTDSLTKFTILVPCVGKSHGELVANVHRFSM